MDSSLDMILSPFKYHEWKEKIGIMLRNKGISRVYLALENEPNATIEKYKWHNRLDEAYGLLFLSIYIDILFHLDGLTTPNHYWPNLSLSLEYKMR